ncbi:MAG: glycosyltransferase [Methanomassiliicoccales archaeon]|nr:MAG: glycosyltransferase [Methanomassiliicoccales archaeon]
MGKDLISVFLPALDEELTIESVIDDIPTKKLMGMGYDVEILVVDGNSKDRTKEIARNKGARVITQQGIGKGLGVREAFSAFKGQYLFMMDADATYPGYHILDIIPLLESGKYDVVLGSRMNGTILPGAMSRFNYIGNKFLTETANALFPNGHKISDVCTGMWGFRREVVKDLNLTAVYFEIEAEMFAKCIKKGYKIGEIPIEYRRRKTPSKLRSMKHGSRIFSQLITEKLFNR